MKGKTFSIYKVIFVITALMAIVIGAGISFMPTKTRSYAAEAILDRTDEDFSQIDTNGNIFSVEKVYVASSKNENLAGSTIVQDFLNGEGKSPSEGWKSMKTSQNKSATEKESYYFKDIPTATNDKIVVKNNTYVKLNNKVSNDNVVSAKNEDSSGNQEAILVSFGQYDLENGIADVDGQEISQMNIMATLNGKPFVDETSKKSRLPGVRQFGGEVNNLYQDFVFVISQIKEYEGHWSFSVEYYYGGNVYTQSFEFYLMFDSSYTKEDVVDENNKYTAEPTLSTDNFNLGSSEQYPTLTYDYTKYDMCYTLTANGEEYKYVYKYNSKTNKIDLTVNGKAGDSKSLAWLNANDSGANYVVFVFTESGNYQFNFEYIYGGYSPNENSRPKMNLETIKCQLKINGYQVKYSKYGYEEAQMKYLNIVHSTADDGKPKADLIVPNGHNLQNADPSIKKLGVVYDLIAVTGSYVKVGAIDESISKDPNINLDPSKNISNPNELLALVNNNYVKTNQGSIWISSANEYVESESFYYFSKTGKLTEEEINAANQEPLNNTTEFNKTGYYILVVGVDTDADDVLNFKQVFAFQYTTDTVNINVVDVDPDDGTKVIGAGKFTNNKVKVSWEDPGVFDRKIEANYYYAQSHDRETILNRGKNSLNNGDEVGSEVIDSSSKTWFTYVVEIKSEGDAATYRMFTIDNQDISGVAVYAVEQKKLNDDVFYEFATKDNKLLKIDAISNSYSTLFWNNKASGAEIVVKYDFTPFVQDSSVVLDDLKIKDTSDDVWFKTTYKLGTKATGLEIFKANKLSNYGVEMDSSQVFSQQGIYEFTLTDAAGNSCKYMFVVDKTESYFYVESKIGTDDAKNDLFDNGKFTINSNEIYSDNIRYTVGTHKVIDIGVKTSLSNVIISAINNNLKANSSLKYYVSDANHTEAIQKIFSDFNNNGIIKVRNMSVEAKTSEGAIDRYSSLTSSSGLLKGEGFNSQIIKRNETDLGSSVIKKLRIIGENQYLTEDLNSVSSKLKNISFIQVEINADNSRGYVYTRNDRKFTTSPEGEGNGISRLFTGTDVFKESQGIEGIDGAHATSDKYVIFSWLVGADNTKVAKVDWTFYEFDATLNTENYSSDLFFYKNQGKTTTVFENDVYSEGAKVDDNGRAFAVINESNGMTREGLYKITRTYANDVVEGSKDFTKFTYYFIVDRHGVIDGAAGREIQIFLLENETAFKDFKQHNAISGNLEFANEDINYNVYLTTNKVPATLNIPVGKYFNGKQGTNYFAGRLTFSVYFKDTEGLLGKQGNPYPLFNMDTTASGEDENWNNNGTYKIDFSKEYSKFESVFQALNDKNSSNWMYVPGDYVIVINDLIEGANGNNQKIIAFRVQQEKPKAEIYVTTEQGTRYDEISGNNTTLTTNQKYVKLEIPAYDTDETMAQLDQYYLVVTQKINNVTKDYIRYEYGHKNGYNLYQDDKNIVNWDNGNVTILLTTVNANGNLINDIEYTVTVRYKLGDDTSWEKYINCYKVKGVNYYTQTYTVTIDRTAPTVNIDSFTDQNGANYDSLIADFNARDGVDDMFEDATYGTDILYFTNRYAAFYTDTQKTSELYAFKVTDTTDYSTEDVDKIYVRTIMEFNKDKIVDYNTALSTLKLTLPVTAALGETTIIESLKDITNFGDILNGKNAGIYEIVEFDKAGNMTQYLVEYGVSQTVGIKATIETINSTADVSFGTSAITYFGLNDLVIETDTKFFSIQVKDSKGNVVSTIYSDFTSSATNIANKLKEAITSKFGGYTVIVKTRDIETKYTLNYYNREDLRTLSLDKLVDKTNLPWVINLAAANESEGDQLYYLEKIVVKYVNQKGEGITKIFTSNDGLKYIDENNKEKSSFETIPGATYVINAQDSAHRPVTTYKFKSGDNDYVYYGIKFGADGNANAVDAEKYYSYQQATIEFDTTAFTKAEVVYKIPNREPVKVNSESHNESLQFESKQIVKFENGKVILYPYFANNGTGTLIEFSVYLYEMTIDGVEVGQQIYQVVMDTRTNAVVLRDGKTGAEEGGVEFDANIDVFASSTPKMSSGDKMLYWTKEADHDKFNYSYFLYEKLKEADASGRNYRVRDLNNEPGFYHISTSANSLGEYRFVIEVSDKFGNYLGRKIFTFAVKAELNRVYYVQTTEGENVVANSMFTYAELFDRNGDEIFDFEDNFPLNISGDIPLYITNQDLEVLIINNTDITERIYRDKSIDSGDGTKYFEIHEIDAKTYKLYFGILKTVNTTGNLINQIAIIDQDEQATAIWSDMLYPSSVEGVAVVGEQFKLLVDSIDQGEFLNKNTIMVNVKYGEEYIDSFELHRTHDFIELRGNGTYIFEVKDLAGNIQIFKTQYGAEFEYVQATVLREVEVKVNESAPLNKAFYNGIVDVAIVNRGNYEQGSVSWVAYRNGVEYMSNINIYSFSFKDYGSYSIMISAKTKQGDKLTKVINFTIVNAKEAKKAFDLTNISSYKITEVLDNDGEDITENFLEMLEFNEAGRIVTYDMILNNPNFDIGSGKQTFTVSYMTDEGLYPTRNVTFQFTLNNENPFIECSLAPGEKTTKEFSISFNPGIIYKQIGEAVICVNGQAVVRIDENSKLELIQKSFSEKVNGAGDYYITIQNLSGDVITAFKVTIKEPLNASAIIIIVVVSVVVIAIVVTFIVLRTRMRIR